VDDAIDYSLYKYAAPMGRMMLLIILYKYFAPMGWMMLLIILYKYFAPTGRMMLSIIPSTNMPPQ